MMFISERIIYLFVSAPPLKSLLTTLQRRGAGEAATECTGGAATECAGEGATECAGGAATE